MAVRRPRRVVEVFTPTSTASSACRPSCIGVAVVSAVLVGVAVVVAVFKVVSVRPLAKARDTLAVWVAVAGAGRASLLLTSSCAAGVAGLVRASSAADAILV